MNPRLKEIADKAYRIYFGDGQRPAGRSARIGRRPSTRSVNRYLELFLESHSATAAAMEAKVGVVEQLMRAAGATDLTVVRTAQLEARHQAYWAHVNIHPRHVHLITDTAVPRQEHIADREGGRS